MNNLHNTRTSLFLDELNKDRSQIVKIDPIVIFRNILGLGEVLDTSSVLTNLQRSATSVGRQTETQKLLVQKSYVGEVISFDIGRDPIWCTFRVVREPLQNDPDQIAVNFIVVVNDREHGKRYERLVGAIQLEHNDKTNTNQATFRTISDIIETTDLEPPVSTENLKPLEASAPAEAQKVEEVEPVQEETKPAEEALVPKETIIFKEGDSVTFIPDEEDENAAKLVCGETEVMMVSSEFPVMRDTKSKTYKVDKDITQTMIENDGFAVFGMLSLIREEKWPKVNKLEEVILHTDMKVIFERGEKDEIIIFDENKVEITRFTDPNVETVEPGEYIVLDEVKRGFLKGSSLSEIMEKFDLIPDPNEIMITKDEVVNLEQYPGKNFRALKDLSRAELADKDIPESDKFEEVVRFEDNWKTPEEVEAIEHEREEQALKEEEAKKMDEIVYHKGEEFEMQGTEGKFRALQDITVGMTRERNGDISDLVEPVQANDAPPKEETHEPIPDIDDEHKAPAVSAKPIGDIPKTTLCKDEHTAAEYMVMLFGSTTPPILRVFNKLKEANANNKQVELTGTWPTETMIVYSDYTFSIVRMKNGSFYRCFVAHTEMNRLEKSSWLLTNDEENRWFTIGNITDRDVGQINSRRGAN